MKHLSHSMHSFLQECHSFIHLHMDGSFPESPPDFCSKPTSPITLTKIATPPPPSHLSILSPLLPPAHSTARSILFVSVRTLESGARIIVSLTPAHPTPTPPPQLPACRLQCFCVPESQAHVQVEGVGEIPFTRMR